MAIHLLPLLLAKVAGKLIFKKAAVHHAAHHTLGRKIAKEAGQKAVSTAVNQATAPKNPKGGQTS